MQDNFADSQLKLLHYTMHAGPESEWTQRGKAQTFFRQNSGFELNVALDSSVVSVVFNQSSSCSGGASGDLLCLCIDCKAFSRSFLSRVSVSSSSILSDCCWKEKRVTVTNYSIFYNIWRTSGQQQKCSKRKKKTASRLLSVNNKKEKPTYWINLSGFCLN